MIRAIRRFVFRVLGDVLRKSQVKTLAALVPGLIRSQQLGIAAIGRCLGGDAKPKNGIKRVFRFTSNEGVDVTATARAMIAMLCQPGNVIGIAMDWTKIGDFQVLTSAVVTKHRAIPVHWTVIDELETRMKDAELDHIATLRELVPRENGPVILADRGFDDVAFLRELGADFQLVVRSANSTCVRLQAENDFQRLSQISIERNRVYDFGQIDFRKDDPLQIRLVIVHDSQQADPWILLTNIEGGPPRDIVRWYGRRFEIEEAFRDLMRIPPNPNSQSARWRMPSPLDGERPFRSMANGDSAQAEFGVGAKRRRSLSRGEFMRHGSFFPCLATHRFSLQRDFGRRTNESIQQGVRDAGIANGVMPLLDGVLAGHEGRPDPSPIVNHFKEGVLTRPLERVQCPIVEDEKVSARQAGEHLEVGAVGPCDGQLLKQSGDPLVDDAVPFPACFVAQRAAEPGLA